MLVIDKGEWVGVFNIYIKPSFKPKLYELRTRKVVVKNNRSFNWPV